MSKAGTSGADLQEYARVLLARRWLLVSACLLVVLGTALYAYSQSPIYRSNALILIQPAEVQLLGGIQGVKDPLSDLLSTQYQLIASSRIAEPVWRAQGYDKRLSLDAFRKQIAVEPQKGSRLVSVGFTCPIPPDTCRIANALVESYMADHRARAAGVTDEGLARLRQKQIDLRQELELTDRALSAFRQSHPELPFEGTPATTTTRLDGLNLELIRAESERIALEAEAAAIESSQSLLQETDVRYHLLRQDVALARQRYDELLTRLKPGHPMVRQAAERQLAAQQRLEAAVGEALAAARGRLRAAAQRETTLRAEVGRLSRSFQQSSVDLIRYRLLAKAHEDVAKNYEDVSKRIREIELAESTSREDTNVFWVETAQVPRFPIYPNKTKMLTTAGVMGLLLGVGLCFLVDYLDRSLKSKEEVERLLNLPVVGYVPAVELKEGTPHELEGANPRSHLSEAFRTVRTGVVYGVMAGQGGRARQLLVTSTLPREGKTLVSTNISFALAQQRKRVLLVDCDMRKPRVHQVFQIERDAGLSTILAGEAEIEDLESLSYPVEQVPGLSVLSAGPIPPNPADLLNSERMESFLRFCEDKFDWVILDAPPSALADPAILSALVKNVLFVVRAFSTPRDLAVQAVHALTSVGGRIVGVVMNNADVASRAGGLGYGYGYGYSYAYKYGYGREASDPSAPAGEAPPAPSTPRPPRRQAS